MSYQSSDLYDGRILTRKICVTFLGHRVEDCIKHYYLHRVLELSYLLFSHNKLSKGLYKAQSAALSENTMHAS